LLLSINPILKSDSTGPAAGYLCIGRYLGDAEVAKIAQLTSTDLSVISAADAGTAWGVMHETLSTQEGSAIVRISPEGNTITSFVVIDDIHGVPAAVFRVDSPRTTHQIAME